jgi:hypothetical protein
MGESTGRRRGQAHRRRFRCHVRRLAADVVAWRRSRRHVRSRPADAVSERPPPADSRIQTIGGSAVAPAGPVKHSVSPTRGLRRPLPVAASWAAPQRPEPCRWFRSADSAPEPKSSDQNAHGGACPPAASRSPPRRRSGRRPPVGCSGQRNAHQGWIPLTRTRSEGKLPAYGACSQRAARLIVRATRRLTAPPSDRSPSPRMAVSPRRTRWPRSRPASRARPARPAPSSGPEGPR